MVKKEGRACYMPCAMPHRDYAVFTNEDIKRATSPSKIEVRDWGTKVWDAVKKDLPKSDIRIIGMDVGRSESSYCKRFSTGGAIKIDDITEGKEDPIHVTLRDGTKLILRHPDQIRGVKIPQAILDLQRTLDDAARDEMECALMSLSQRPLEMSQQLEMKDFGITLSVTHLPHPADKNPHIKSLIIDRIQNDVLNNMAENLSGLKIRDERKIDETDS